MGNGVDQWRVSIGLFDSRVCVCRQRVKVSFSWNFTFQYFVFLLSGFNHAVRLMSTSLKDLVNNLDFKLLLLFLILEAGDVEMNPGPNTTEHSLSIIHSNIRSIRNKFDFITEYFLDFDILCFTETHLDVNILSDSLILTDKFDAPYRKDRSNHGGGLLVYLSHELVHKRRLDLEGYRNESIWAEIKVNRQIYLIGTFYSPRTSDANFFDSLNKNIEKALDITNNVIIVGDMNEDLLNPNVHNLKDILILNSLNNVNPEPTRQHALLDPIIIHNDMSFLHHGILEIPPEISDHSATYLYLPFQYPLHRSFTRKVWLYKNANFELLNNKILQFDWTCLNQGVSHRMLKGVAKSISKPLSILMNRSFNEGIFPKAWKVANVIPIFKKGDKSLPSNYRPVALLSCLGKLQERIVFKNLYNFLIDNNLLYKYQSGFLPHHSTVFQLIDIYHNICQAFDNNLFSCIVFCDVSKAFDRVWHRGLLFKLRQNGIDGKLLRWLNSYLTNRKQKVTLKSCASTIKSILAGVPQGSVLGPLLFLVYINDIAKQLLSLTRLFADDSSLFYAAARL